MRSLCVGNIVALKFAVHPFLASSTLDGETWTVDVVLASSTIRFIRNSFVNALITKRLQTVDERPKIRDYNEQVTVDFLKDLRCNAICQ